MGKDKTIIRLKEIFRAVLPVGLILVMLFFVLIGLFNASLEFCGYGVDSAGNLYIGRLHQVEVYQKGVRVNTLEIPVSRGWCMTVSNDEIIVANMSSIFVLDLAGNVVREEEDRHGKIFYSIKDTKQVLGADGSQYSLSDIGGIIQITENGKTIYQSPIEDILAKLTFWTGSVCMIVGFLGVGLEKLLTKDE